MHAQHIALTSANEQTMATVAEYLIARATRECVPIVVHIGVNNAFDAQAIYVTAGELWRIGEDDSRPELDVLIDRAIVDGPRLIANVDEALHRFLNKTAIAA